jgi:hypothetical protein
MCRAFSLFIWLSAIMLFFQVLFIRNAGADGIDLNGEITYQDIDSKNTNRVTGDKFRSDTYTLFQNYNLDLSKTIYPFLTFETGTLFELNQATTKSQGEKAETEQRVLKPFVELQLNNPIYQASLKYTRTEIHEEITNTPNTDDTRDEYDAILGWQPADLPEVVLRYSYTHTYDDPETVDLVDKLLTLNSNYSAWRELEFNYVYTRSETENRLSGLDTLEQIHFGRAGYGHDFWDGLFYFDTNYRITYSTFKFSGAQSAQVPLLRFQGLFSLDDSPEDGELALVVNGLIDGNRTAATVVDIGSNVANPTTLRNIGVDLGSSVPANEIRIWVNQRLTDVVANSFSWSVYTSPTNDQNSTWTLVATVSPASFGTFDNVFTISFAQVNTRFIKVVTAPLSPLVPGAGVFPSISVTEMETFGTASQSSALPTQKNIDWTYELNLRSRVTDKTSLGYNFFYNYRDQDPISNKRTEVSNTLSLNHIFNEMFSTSGSFNRDDRHEENMDTVEYNYSLLLKGVYLPTFTQTLTFSGRNAKQEDDSSDDFSVILRSNASLYSGWSALVDVGYNWNRPVASDTTQESILLRASTNFVPNPMLTINLDYLQREIVEPDRDSRYDFTAEAFFVPTRAWSFNARFNIVKRSDLKTKTLQNYSVTWSPFPEGALQFFFNYNETLQSAENQRETTVGPGFNWTISNHFFLEMNYSYQETKSDSLKTEAYNLFARFRLIF